MANIIEFFERVDPNNNFSIRTKELHIDSIECQKCKCEVNIIDIKKIVPNEYHVVGYNLHIRCHGKTDAIFISKHKLDISRKNPINRKVFLQPPKYAARLYDNK